MKTAVQRYDWLDALIEAQAIGLISNGELNTGTKLAHAINWVPKNGGASELRWSNDEASEVVGLARSAFYDNMPLLVEHGFMVKEGNNYRPVLPDNLDEIRQEFKDRQSTIRKKYEEKKRVKEEAAKAKSESRTTKSRSRTSKSGSQTTESESRTSKSEFQHTYSVDTCSEDLGSVDSSSGDSYREQQSSPAEPMVQTKEGKPGTKNTSSPTSFNDNLPLSDKSFAPSPNLEGTEATLAKNKVEEFRKSESRTGYYTTDEVQENINGIGQGRVAVTTLGNEEW